jgi:hypothetical protein
MCSAFVQLLVMKQDMTDPGSDFKTSLLYSCPPVKVVSTIAFHLFGSLLSLRNIEVNTSICVNRISAASLDKKHRSVLIRSMGS